ncbi:zinc-ribbon domain-containing protein [Ureibacillus chungkukjangi]|uniref:zinc-ribbon domain-containing protein n=1 Tax=Ureibacillus chungkukjangi TaxID=1202712 RepID=UPI00203E0C3A|nr:zinc-ribbon domain-containing protein [Ureibacillus chungkukjangi]MCM3387344.1 zinc-ribbon domain-containing protein [Ureibacillus chungkukjangi]
MCKETIVNIQTGELLEWDKVHNLKDNAMLKVRPDLWVEWDFSKNSVLEIYEITKGTHKKVWWVCPNCTSGYDMKISEKTQGYKCPYCRGLRINETNSLASLRPDIAKDWNYEKNGKLTPCKITCSSHKSVWWKCSSCNSDYDMKVYNKTSNNCNCPYCTGKRVNETNSLSSIRPDIAAEWHPTKNGSLTPHDVTCGSHRNIWWKCSKGHEWKTKVETRTKNNGTNCPFCQEHCNQVLIGFNDMWTTNPELASLLANPEDGYKYMQSSSKKLDWECPDCGETVRGKSANNVKKQGINCGICKDNLSIGEKIIYSLLIANKHDFVFDGNFDWSKNRRYDFYLPKYNIIIELHGLQHYKQTDRASGRTLEEEQENDQYKYEMAVENGIESYIVIDCRKSDFNYIKENVLKSELVSLLNIDEGSFAELSFKSNLLTTMSWNLWNEGLSVTEIADKLKIYRNTITKYLILGSSLGKCNYNVNLKYENMKKRIVELDFKGNVLKTFNSVKDAERHYEKRIKITNYPFNIGRKANDSIFVYEKEFVDYKDDLLQEINQYNFKNNICQLNNDLNLVKLYTNLSEASKENGFEFTNLYAVCNGRRNSAYGFRWMYRREYEQQFGEIK